MCPCRISAVMASGTGATPATTRPAELSRCAGRKCQEHDARMRPDDAPSSSGVFVLASGGWERHAISMASGGARRPSCGVGCNGRGKQAAIAAALPRPCQARDWDARLACHNPQLARRHFAAALMSQKFSTKLRAESAGGMAAKAAVCSMDSVFGVNTFNSPSTIPRYEFSSTAR